MAENKEIIKKLIKKGYHFAVDINDTVRFKDIGMDGVWDDEVHDIPYEDITQISYGDNYSKMYYKYVTK